LHMSTRKVYGPLFFREDTVTGTSYLEMLQTWLFPRQQEDEPEDFIMQQDGPPPRFCLDVLRWLNNVLPHRWIMRGVHEDLMFFSVACTVPRFNPLWLLHKKKKKKKVFVPPQPVNIPDMKNRITAPVETINMICWSEYG
jgi:hypothetical protein